MDNIFTNQIFDDTIFPEYRNWEDNIMTLYTYTDKQTAENLFRYYIGLHYNQTIEYISKKPISVPLTLYESPSIAKEIIKPSQNLQLIAFDVSTQYLYDQLDIVQQSKNTEQLKKLKNLAHVWRELAKHDKYQYIKYTVRNKDAINTIRIIDNI